MTPPAHDALDAFDALPLPSDASPDQRAPLQVASTDALDAIRRRRRTRAVMLLAAAVSAASMFGLVAFHVFEVQTSFQLDNLQQRLTEEQQQYGKLRAEVATRSSPQAVAAGAEALHMVRPSQVSVLHVPGARPLDATNSLPVLPTPDYRSIAAGP